MLCYILNGVFTQIPSQKRGHTPQSCRKVLRQMYMNFNTCEATFLNPAYRVCVKERGSHSVWDSCSDTLPEPFLHMWWTWSCLPALHFSSSSNGRSTCRTALQINTIIYHYPVTLRPNFIIERTGACCRKYMCSLCCVNLCPSYSKLCGIWPLPSRNFSMNSSNVPGSSRKLAIWWK